MFFYFHWLQQPQLEYEHVFSCCDLCFSEKQLPLQQYSIKRSETMRILQSARRNETKVHWPHRRWWLIHLNESYSEHPAMPNMSLSPSASGGGKWRSLPNRIGSLAGNLMASVESLSWVCSSHLQAVNMTSFHLPQWETAVLWGSKGWINRCAVTCQTRSSALFQELACPVTKPAEICFDWSLCLCANSCSLAVFALHKTDKPQRAHSTTLGRRTV